MIFIHRRDAEEQEQKFENRILIINSLSSGFSKENVMTRYEVIKWLNQQCQPKQVKYFFLKISE